ncbi:MAG: hypothetical protein A3A08_01755 [Candidatus Nealsonbacteria bacterium RIFCSPLOWO2_01_FULL_41_9]|uniref:Uncharacterized protein n=1 Tax=Candidatus Nealsonbacteria bacterium RIFCSPLOWO2_01_FULL_41_9 TaxID=1801671 RepID=A0A1G2EDE0_9BACT|nr:MAG: hypothetical protein A3A08_01755 [Candidatus Nealsonbacteria bacterium RIFCSPLOWO2_01_FULL_41_9]
MNKENKIKNRLKVFNWESFLSEENNLSATQAVINPINSQFKADKGKCPPLNLIMVPAAIKKALVKNRIMSKRIFLSIYQAFIYKSADEDED